jgi:outer membrane lipoprotein SlyB
VINGVLASNSIASPQLVDYRIQSAILGIISPADFLAALGANPCDGLFTDSSERATCVDLLSKPDFVAELTDIVKVVLTSLQTCATDFADGGSAAPITITDPTCPAPPTVRRNVQKRYEIDLTASILADIEHYRSTAVASALGPKKMSSRSLDLIALSRRQADTCANTEQCFERCPGCRDAQTYCGTTVIDMTTEICNAVSFTAGPIVGTVSAAVCGAACGPVAAFCAGICGTLAGGAAQRAVDKTCAVSMAAICDQLRKRCANCNNSNNDICNPDSTQCCPGETGTDCGQGCCCCPECQAPGGINCACTDAPC